MSVIFDRIKALVSTYSERIICIPLFSTSATTHVISKVSLVFFYIVFFFDIPCRFLILVAI